MASNVVAPALSDDTETTLPSCIRLRMLALLKLQYELMECDVEFHRRLFELESEINEKRQTIYAKRAAIIKGEYEPIGETYTSSQTVLFEEVLGKLELSSVDYTEKSVGIPNFWLEILKHGSILYFHESDEPILAHLYDIQLKLKRNGGYSAVLEFYFSENPYFEDAVLTKEFFLEMGLEVNKPFLYEGPEVYKSVGCEIKWKSNRDASLHSESFFQLFAQSHGCGDGNDDDSELLEGEFEMAMFIKENFIPHAALFFISIHNWNDSDDDSDYDEYGSLGGGSTSDGERISYEDTTDSKTKIVDKADVVNK